MKQVKAKAFGLLIAYTETSLCGPNSDKSTTYFIVIKYHKSKLLLFVSREAQVECSNLTGQNQWAVF